MKAGMSNVDVACLAAELAPILSGSRVDKAFQPAKDQVVIRFRSKISGRLDLLCELGRFITITKRPPDNPESPSMVAKIIRSDYGNGRVVGVSQIGFDRLLRIDVEKGDGVRSIVFEMFGDGNMLLLDPDGSIRLPMRGADHGARKLRKGEPYVPPPAGVVPFDLAEAEFAKLGRQGVKDVIRFLAVDLGFGPQWAEELCLRAEVAKGAVVEDVSPEQWGAVWGQVSAIAEQIGRHDFAPVIVYKQSERVDAIPFEMVAYSGTEFAAEEAESFRAALDSYFVGVSDEDDQAADPRQRAFDEARGKLQRRIDQMRSSIAKFQTDEARRKSEADVLYLRFQEVQSLLQVIMDAHDKGNAWNEIQEKIKSKASEDPLAAMLLELRHDASALLSLSNLENEQFQVNVDVRKSVQDNAESLYAEGKKAAERQKGAKTALKKSENELAELERRGLDGFGAAPKRKQATSRHFWFESYRFCFGPDGALIVGGRNAGQNDAVVKKYLRDGDRYVHAAIHGAPSVVIRPPATDESPSETDLKAAGQFAVCASRAWRQFGSASAYWVTAQQVNKTPRSGEFVPRGAWIVHGKRNQMDGLPMEWGVGTISLDYDGNISSAKESAKEGDKKVRKIVGGPWPAIQATTQDAVQLVPGELEPNDAAVQISERFECTMEEAQGVLPGGPVRFGGGT